MTIWQSAMICGLPYLYQRFYGEDLIFLTKADTYVVVYRNKDKTNVACEMNGKTENEARRSDPIYPVRNG